MNELISKNPLVIKIVCGQASEEILEMFFSKQLALTEEEYLESLVFLMKEEKFKAKALEELKKIAKPVKSNYIEKSQANHRVAYYIIMEALAAKDSDIIGKAAKNQMIPPEFLEKIAGIGVSSMLEIMLDNQIKMIAFPRIMEVMEKNPQATKFILGRIKEIREFYLEDDEPGEISASDIIDDIKEVISKDPEPEDEIEVESAESVEKQTLTTLQLINKMSTAERIKLAVTGTRTHRMILVKDSNKMVSLAVVESPKLTIPEISAIIRNKSIPMEVITRISTNRDWTKNYDIALGLVMNPKTPVKNAITLMKKIHIRDLKFLSRDKNISPVTRNVAMNFYREKSRVKKKT